MITDLIKRLSRNPLKDRVCRKLKIYYHMGKFTTYMDMNPNYTATNNGIIDLRGGRYTIRPGKPEDSDQVDQ